MPADAAIPDLLIFWLVVAGRLLLTLFIPRFPLPAIPRREQPGRQP